jgi:basic membrane protein A and related proteins
MKKMVSRLGFVVVVFAILAAACAPAATPTVAPAPAATQPPQVVVQTQLVQSTVVQVVTATPAPTTEAGPFKIAVILPSPVNDAAFSQSMWEGLLAVQKEMGGESKLTLAKSENMFNVPDAQAAIRDYATKGFDLVIAHGSQYGDSLAQVAPDFPNTSFAWGTSLDTYQEQGINNIFAYQANAEQGGYVLGTVAAMMSKSSKLGVIGPIEAGDAKLYVDGFKAGAKKAKPAVGVAVTYTGSFSDNTAMANAATTQIQNGADMLTGSSQAVVGAIGVAKSKKVMWFGTQWDQTSLAPDIVVASQVYDWTAVIKDMIASHQAGVMGNKGYTLTFKNAGLKIQYNSAITVSADVKAAADAAIKGIEDGTIKPLGQ